MADIAKYKPINGARTVTADFENMLSIIKTRTAAFFMFAFVAFTFFLAFTPSSNPFSPWVTNTCSPQQQQQQQQQEGLRFTCSSNNTAPQLANPREEPPSERNTNTIINNNQTSVLHANQSTVSTPAMNNSPPSTSDQGEKKENFDKPQVFKANQTTIITEEAPLIANQSTNPSAKSDSSNKVSSGKGRKSIPQKGGASNYTASPTKKQGIENLVESLMSCDFFDGGWVKDNSYPLYEPGSCPFVEDQFSCITNGRPDKDYQKFKWKPKGCTLPRLNGAHMLELLRGKRLAFVGDSLNRNMWESLSCILRGAAKNPKNVYEAHGRHNFRAQTAYYFIFKDYNCSLEFFMSPFLVRPWKMADHNGTKKKTLRLDLIGKLSDRYKSADILIFNTGHWWNHNKTSQGKGYYQEGSHVYDDLDVLEAFRKALTTWARWVDANVNPMKSMVLFKGYSASHFSNGQWYSGVCDSETEPIKNETNLAPYPSKGLALESVLKGMKTHVTYLNITKLTEFRKDGHPSIYRKPQKQQMSIEKIMATLKYQDCGHWCLPGVPDSWNELLYAELLVKEAKMHAATSKKS